MRTRRREAEGRKEGKEAEEEGGGGEALCCGVRFGLVWSGLGGISFCVFFCFFSFLGVLVGVLPSEIHYQQSGRVWGLRRLLHENLARVF